MKFPSTWQHWLKGLVAAAIGGASTAITTAAVEPTVFNFDTGLPRLGKLAVVSGLFCAAAYLKQSPIPADAPAADALASPPMSREPNKP